MVVRILRIMVNGLIMALLIKNLMNSNKNIMKRLEREEMKKEDIKLKMMKQEEKLSIGVLF